MHTAYIPLEKNILIIASLCFENKTLDTYNFTRLHRIQLKPDSAV